MLKTVHSRERLWATTCVVSGSNSFRQSTGAQKRKAEIVFDPQINSKLNNTLEHQIITLERYRWYVEGEHRPISGVRAQPQGTQRSHKAQHKGGSQGNNNLRKETMEFHAMTAQREEAKRELNSAKRAKLLVQGEGGKGTFASIQGSDVTRRAPSPLLRSEAAPISWLFIGQF